MVARALLLLFFIALDASPVSSLPDGTIQQAVRAGDLEALRRWIASGRSVRFLEAGSGFRLLHVAVDAGQLEAARMLLGAGADPRALTRSGWGALALACERGHTELVEELLERGCPPDGEPRTEQRSVEDRAPPPPLVVAADAGRTEVVRVLLERGARIDARDAYGGTALFHASQYAHLEVMNVLLADPDRGAWLLEEPDEVGWRPLHVAAAHGRIDALELLMARGANVEARTAAGFTALDLARYFGHVALRALLEPAAEHARQQEQPAWWAEGEIEAPALELRNSRWSAAGREDPVLVLVHRSAGCPGPVPWPSGLLFALWSDGTLLFARVWARPGEHVAVSVVSAAGVQELLALLDECVMTRIPAHPPGSLTESLYFDRSGGRVELCWGLGRAYDERLHGDRLLEVRGFLAALELSRKLFEGLHPENGTALDPLLVNGMFRGYGAESPWGTRWMHGR